MTDKPIDVQSMIEAAMRSLAQGDKAAAELLARQAAELAPGLEKPWLILAAVVPPEEKLQYIQKALQINPQSEAAKKALEWAKSQLPPKPEIAQSGVKESQAEQSPEGGLSNESPISYEAEDITELAAKAVRLPDASFQKPCDTETPAASEPSAAIPAAVEQPAPKPLAEVLPVQPPVEKPISQPAEKQTPTAATAEPAKRKTTALRIILLSLLILVIIAALVIWIFFRPLAIAFMARLFPSEGCTPNLVLGNRLFAIHTIKQANDGSLQIPGDQPGMIFWVDGTNVNAVYALSPAADNEALQSNLTAGTTAVVTQAGCNTTSYILSAPVAGVPDTSALMDQSLSRITIFMPPFSTSSGFVILGDLQGETISKFNSPNPAELQAEISLLGTTTSADKTTITVSISINNTGQTAGELNTTTVSLTPGMSAPQSPVSSDPALPLTIALGKTVVVKLVFNRPVEPTATLKVFSAEYELSGY